MNCDDSKLSAYLDHELPAAERRAVEVHLQSCPDCAATLKDLERVRTMLLTQAVPMGLHVPVIDRIRNEEQPAGPRSRWLSMAVAAVLFAMAALAAVLYAFNSPTPESPNEQVPMFAIEPDDEPAEERQMFAEDTTGTVGTPDQIEPATLAETKLPLTLTGTLLSGDPQAVLVNNDSGEQHIYRPGDTVLEDVVLHEIQQSRVILENNGVREVLTKGPGLVATRPSVDGDWQVAVLLDGEIMDYGPVLKLTEVNGTVRMADSDQEDVAGGRIEGRTLILSRTPDSIPSNLRGDFNSTYTEVVLTSPELSQALANDSGQEPGDHIYALKLSKIGEGSLAPDPRAIAQARHDEVRAMYAPLKAYAEDHEGRFPSALAQLVPEYVNSLDLYADREDRIVSYIPGHALQDLSQLERIPGCSKSSDPAQTFLLHEAKLQEFWGGPAPFAPTLVEVTYGDPYQVTTLNVHGGSTSRSITDEALIAAPQSAIEEARWQALVASDQNNLKQLGLINKMFANENCMYTIPGFCTVFPEYLTDPGVLTSPWDEPGTVSYELLFPAVTEEELEELGIQYLESKGDVDPNNPALSAQAQSVVPLIFNTTDIPAIGDSPAARNVLFLDGHVERLTLDAFEERVGPFLR
jgi:prepilin-type processing-associated H-X9-DG protein